MAGGDPTKEMLDAARGYPDVAEGESCNQTSFKVGKTAFFYAGPQGGRFKAMFKLDASLDEASDLAAADPKGCSVGKNGWVTVWFGADAPMAKRRWKKWLKESYELSAAKKR